MSCFRPLPSIKFHVCPVNILWRGDCNVVNRVQRYSCDVLSLKKSYLKFRYGSFLMVGGESDSIANICCKKKDYGRLSLHNFLKDTKSLWSSAPEKNQFFTWWKRLSKLSEASWRIHRVSMKLQQRGMVVTDGLTPFVTPFVTSPHWNVIFSLKCQF